MFFENYFIKYSQNISINSISSYRCIMNKFILKFILKKKYDYIIKSKTSTSELYLDAIIYSKYYLYWKIFGCSYQEKIMNLLYDIEFIN